MKRPWNSGRRSAIERKARRENARTIEELRRLQDGRDSKIRALEGRLRKVEAQNVELMAKFFDARLSARSGDFIVQDDRGNRTVYPNELLEVRLHFNTKTYPSLWDSCSDFARVANVLADLMQERLKKIEEPRPDQTRRFERLTECGDLKAEVKALAKCDCVSKDGNTMGYPVLPMLGVPVSEAFADKYCSERAAVDAFLRARQFGKTGFQIDQIRARSARDRTCELNDGKDKS